MAPKRTASAFRHSAMLSSEKRNAGFLVMCGAPLEVPKVEADAAQTLMQNIQHLQAGGDDLGTDPIAGENRDTEAWSTFHRCCSFALFLCRWRSQHLRRHHPLRRPVRAR
jgi:hypothetical protein